MRRKTFKTKISLKNFIENNKDKIVIKDIFTKTLENGYIMFYEFLKEGE